MATTPRPAAPVARSTSAPAFRGFETLDALNNNYNSNAFWNYAPEGSKSAFQQMVDKQRELSKTAAPKRGDQRYGFVRFGEGMDPEKDNRSWQEKFSKTKGAGLWAMGINPDDPQAEAKAQAMLKRILDNPKYKTGVWGDKEWGRDDAKMMGVRQILAANPNVSATELLDYAKRAPQAQNALQPRDIGGMIGDTLAQIALTVMSGGNPTLAVMYGAAKGGSDTGSLLGAGLGGLSGLGTGLGTGSFMQGVSAAGGGLGGAANYIGSGIKGIANNFLHPIDFLTRTGSNIASGVGSLGRAALHPIDSLGNLINTGNLAGNTATSAGTQLGRLGTPGFNDVISNAITPTFRSGVTIPGIADPLVSAGANVINPYFSSIGRVADTAGMLANPTLSNAAAASNVLATAGRGISPSFESIGTQNSPISSGSSATTGGASRDDKIQRALDLAGDLAKPGTPAAPITSVSMPNTSANLAASLNPITYTPFSKNMAPKFISPAILAAAADKDPMAMAAVSAAARTAFPQRTDKSSAGLFGLNLDAEGGADLGLGGPGLRGLGFAYGGSIEDIKDPMNPMGGAPASQYGLASLEQGGTAEDAPVEGYLDGPGDGMSDSIKATIDGKQPARLADGEFVIPADVVSGLGNGSSKAGAKVLYAMMDRVRQARTGNPKQGKEINAEKFLPA